MTSRRPGALLLTVGAAGLVLAAGCAGPVRDLFPPAAGEGVASVWVVSHGWHTGIAVRREDIPEAVWPEHRDLPRSEFIEVGWGNEDFYLAPRGTLWLAVKAVAWPTPSVLHVVAFDGPVRRFFPGHEVVEVRVSAPGFRRLASFFENAYARDASGDVLPLGPGQYRSSRFYRARERYFLVKTCNTWTAQALRATGAPVTPVYALTAGNVMGQARRLATAAGDD
ncbi:MAG TPA: DUF2459 domain-containing protein [Methylomirabilota bacterium]|nr:DUF2459 domain-containing protein [Methylomirabilota bacterium]